MQILPNVPSGVLIFLFSNILLLSSCTPLQHAPDSATASRSNAPWEGRLQELFNDSIDPSAVGLAGTSVSHAGGAVAARAQEAHFVVRVRVGTVTTEGRGDDLRYLITLRTVGDPVAGPRPPSDTVQVTVTRANPAFGIVQAKDLALAGTYFIAFLREFDENGATVMHWHLARDAQDVVDAARKGAVLSEVSED